MGQNVKNLAGTLPSAGHKLSSQVARFRRVNEDRKCVHHVSNFLRKGFPAHTASSRPACASLAVGCVTTPNRRAPRKDRQNGGLSLSRWL